MQYKKLQGGQIHKVLYNLIPLDGHAITRGDHGAGVPESTPVGLYDFCRSRSRIRSRIFEWKLDLELEQEWEFQFLQESDNLFYQI